MTLLYSYSLKGNELIWFQSVCIFQWAASTVCAGYYQSKKYDKWVGGRRAQRERDTERGRDLDISKKPVKFSTYLGT